MRVIDSAMYVFAHQDLFTSSLLLPSQHNVDYDAEGEA